MKLVSRGGGYFFPTVSLTLLRIVAGLEFADDGPGEILFHGQDVGCQVFHADVHVFQRSAVEFRSRDSFESGATGRAGGR